MMDREERLCRRRELYRAPQEKEVCSLDSTLMCNFQLKCSITLAVHAHINMKVLLLYSHSQLIHVLRLTLASV